MKPRYLALALLGLAMTAGAAGMTVGLARERIIVYLEMTGQTVIGNPRVGRESLIHGFMNLY